MSLPYFIRGRQPIKQAVQTLRVYTACTDWQHTIDQMISARFALATAPGSEETTRKKHGRDD